jgi:hypothetical protein
MPIGYFPKSVIISALKLRSQCGRPSRGSQASIRPSWLSMPVNEPTSVELRRPATLFGSDPSTFLRD